MQSLVRPELPNASVGSSQATTAAVDNSVPLATRPASTHESGKVVQTIGVASDGLGEAQRTLEGIGRLAVDVVIPGHGAPFAEFDDSLERAFARLQAFEADGARMARNAIRACITFKLLDVRSIALDDLSRHLDETPLYRAANQRFLGLDSEALVSWLVKELRRAGVARREHGMLLGELSRGMRPQNQLFVVCGRPCAMRPVHRWSLQAMPCLHA